MRALTVLMLIVFVLLCCGCDGGGTPPAANKPTVPAPGTNLPPSTQPASGGGAPQ